MGTRRTNDFSICCTVRRKFDKIDLDGADGIKGTADDGLPSDSNFDNKSFNASGGIPSGYLLQLGLSDDGTPSGVESIQGRKFTSLGQVNAFSSDPNSTSLTLRIESSSLFQIDSSYELQRLILKLSPETKICRLNWKGSG